MLNLKDPFPVIESLKTNKSELQLSKRVLKLQNENKSLREKLNTATLNNESMLPNKQKIAADKELILRLSENVTKATTLNLDLTSKLKISEGEIESYKKLLIDYQNELSEMKNKHINEVRVVLCFKKRNSKLYPKLRYLYGDKFVSRLSVLLHTK